MDHFYKDNVQGSYHISAAVRLFLFCGTGNWRLPSGRVFLAYAPPFELVITKSSGIHRRQWHLMFAKNTDSLRHSLSSVLWKDNAVPPLGLGDLNRCAIPIQPDLDRFLSKFLRNFAAQADIPIRRYFRKCNRLRDRRLDENTEFLLGDTFPFHASVFPFCFPVFFCPGTQKHPQGRFPWGCRGIYLLRFLEAVRTAKAARAADASRNSVQTSIMLSPVPGVTVGLVGSVGSLGFVAGI